MVLLYIIDLCFFTPHFRCEARMGLFIINHQSPSSIFNFHPQIITDIIFYWIITDFIPHSSFLIPHSSFLIPNSKLLKGTEIHGFFKVTVFGSALKFSTALRGYGLLAQVRGLVCFAVSPIPNKLCVSRALGA